MGFIEWERKLRLLVRIMVFHITEAKGREIQDIAKDSFRQ